jgi:hypothetical protein
MKTPALRSPARLGLLRPTYRGYERLRAVGRGGGLSGGESLPVPPAKLRIRVAGTADVGWFLEGGLLLVSTHGARYLDRLSPPEQEAFGRGEVVVRFEEVAGSNLCTTFHPPASVRDRLGADLELVEEVPEGARGNPHQDLFLFRKPAGEATTPRT